MKIAVINTVILNTGDAAILLALLKLMREAFGDTSEFVIFDNQPEIVSKYYPHLNLKKCPYLSLTKGPQRKPLNSVFEKINKLRFYTAAWLLKNNLSMAAKLLISSQEKVSIDEYLSSDLIISTGGTYLVENYSLEQRFFTLQLALFLNKPLFLFTQSLGPFKIPRHQRIIRRIFQKTRLILLRDEKSQEHLLSIGHVSKNCRVVADSAFALGNLDLIEISRKKQISKLSPRIAISVREWAYFETSDSEIGQSRYTDAIRDLTIYLVEKYSAKVTFVSTCQGIPNYRDDSEFALYRIFEKLPAEIQREVKVDREFRDPIHLAKHLAEYDCVISTRLHMAILALGAGVPVLPIAYEFKTKELFKNLEASDVVIDIEDINSEEIIQKFDFFMEAPTTYWDKYFTNVVKEYGRATIAKETVKTAYEKQLEPLNKE